MAKYILTGVFQYIEFTDFGKLFMETKGESKWQTPQIWSIVSTIYSGIGIASV